MDATHNTNNLNWPLFTISVRDGFGSWFPVGHFLLESQKAVAIQTAIGVLRVWAPAWRPRYSLTDDSKAEQLSIRNAFDGTGIEQFLCQRHLKEVFAHHFPAKYYPKVFRRLMNALWYARSEQEVEEQLRLAVNALEGCRTPGNSETTTEMVNHVRRNWSARQWTAWARTKIPMFLQIRTTSPLEGYHNKIKVHDKADLPKWSLYGVIEDLVGMDDELIARAKLQPRRLAKTPVFGKGKTGMSAGRSGTSRPRRRMPFGKRLHGLKLTTIKAFRFGSSTGVA